MTKYRITVLMAHHNCPKLTHSSNSARPVMVRFGREHERNRNFYRCPACDMEIMLQATVREGADEADSMSN